MQLLRLSAASCATSPGGCRSPDPAASASCVPVALVGGPGGGSPSERRRRKPRKAAENTWKRSSAAVCSRCAVAQ
eukprot:14755040-Alexandrium_andersonii.AAC.1